MFNLQAGQGLGFTGSKEIAFGLGEQKKVVHGKRPYFAKVVKDILTTKINSVSNVAIVEDVF